MSYITSESLHWLKAEIIILEQKKTNTNKNVIEAREQGDLKENAGYHAAKEELKKIESKLDKYKKALSFTELNNTHDKSVNLGCFVQIQDINTMQIQKLRIVGEVEYNPYEMQSIKYITSRSPVAQALNNHTTNDLITVITPGGTKTYKILCISTHP